MAQSVQQSIVRAVKDREKPLLERTRVNILNWMGFLGDQASGHGEGLGQTSRLFFTRAA